MNQQDNSGLAANAQLQGASGLLNTTNCITPYAYGYNQYYYPPNYQVQIRQVANGFIANIDGQDNVYESVETMLEALEKRFKKKNGK